MIDVTALGELLIDFTPVAGGPGSNPLYEQNPGGAPANVLAGLARLGGSGAFIGKVGDDAFGRFLEKTLTGLGVETRGMRFTDQSNTTLAFVHLDVAGDRSFSFVRKPGADTLLESGELDLDLIRQSGIFHFGSLSLTAEPSRTATLCAAQKAKELGKRISYDPNYRPALWESAAQAKQEMLRGLQYADILKISREELALITGTDDLAAGARQLRDGGVQLVAVTLGADGCYFSYANGSGAVPTYDTVVVDTTGAGDAFTAAMLYRISRLSCGLDAVSLEEMTDIVRFANAAGACCAAKRGAIPAMPDLAEIARCRAEIPLLAVQDEREKEQ